MSVDRRKCLENAHHITTTVTLNTKYEMFAFSLSLTLSLHFPLHVSFLSLLWVCVHFSVRRRDEFFMWKLRMTFHTASASVREWFFGWAIERERERESEPECYRLAKCKFSQLSAHWVFFNWSRSCWEASQQMPYVHVNVCDLCVVFVNDVNDILTQRNSFW